MGSRLNNINMNSADLNRVMLEKLNKISELESKNRDLQYQLELHQKGKGETSSRLYDKTIDVSSLPDSFGKTDEEKIKTAISWYKKGYKVIDSSKKNSCTKCKCK